MPTFRERLWPPVRWWLLSALTAVIVFAVLWSVVSTLTAALVGGLVLAGCGLALVAYAAEVVVDANGLVAGPASLPWSAVGRVTELDRAGAAYLRGQGADPRSYLVLRAYAPAAVQVDVDDPADPTPYWYVSTRRPAELAAALVAGRAATG